MFFGGRLRKQYGSDLVHDRPSEFIDPDHEANNKFIEAFIRKRFLSRIKRKKPASIWRAFQ